MAETPTGAQAKADAAQAAAIAAARSPFGFNFTVDPGLVRTTDAVAMLAANGAVFARVEHTATISKIGLNVQVSSGNISVAAYSNSGTGRNAVPGTRLNPFGAVACPASGYAEVALGATVTVNAGDWLALSADNTTATFRSLLAAFGDNDLGKGRQCRMAAAHPLPLNPSGLVATIGSTIVLIGVP